MDMEIQKLLRQMKFIHLQLDDAAVALAASLPYVDKGKIGITGHSSGGAACDMEIAIDNERKIQLYQLFYFRHLHGVMAQV